MRQSLWEEASSVHTSAAATSAALPHFLEAPVVRLSSRPGGGPLADVVEAHLEPLRHLPPVRSLDGAEVLRNPVAHARQLLSRPPKVVRFFLSHGEEDENLENSLAGLQGVASLALGEAGQEAQDAEYEHPEAVRSKESRLKKWAAFGGKGTRVGRGQSRKTRRLSKCDYGRCTHWLLPLARQ